MEAFNYGEYSLDNLVEALGAKNGTGYPDIFNTAFLYEPFQRESPDMDRFELVFILSAFHPAPGLHLQVKYPGTPGLRQCMLRDIYYQAFRYLHLLPVWLLPVYSRVLVTGSLFLRVQPEIHGFLPGNLICPGTRCFHPGARGPGHRFGKGEKDKGKTAWLYLIKSFCGGPGGGFYKKSPLAAGGKIFLRSIPGGSGIPWPKKKGRR